MGEAATLAARDDQRVYTISMVEKREGRDMMSLGGRAVAGLATLIVVMGLAIFPAAGRLDFREGWSLLGVYAGASGLITAWLWRHDKALLARRVKAGPGAEADPAQKCIQALAGVVFLANLAIPGLDRRFGWSHAAPALALAGDTLVAIGFWVVFRVFRDNSFTSAAVELMEGQRAVDTGPYAIVRHPMYAGALVLFVGTPLALGSWWGLLAAAVLVPILVVRLGREEAFLARHLDGYADYRMRVRFRLIPGVW